MKHRNSIEFEVYGDYALFSDPNMRLGGEKCTYSIPTYEAIKGIIHSIYYKPTIIWYVDEIRVMNPIQTETKGVLTAKYASRGGDRSYYTYLKDVRYQVRAHFEFNMNRPELEQDRNEHKHHNIARRMVERGGRRDIFLGTRECRGFVEPCVFGEGKSEFDSLSHDMSFGFMYNGITYADEAICPEDKGNITVRYCEIKMKPGGYIEFPRPDEIRTKRTAVTGFKVKRFGTDTVKSVNAEEREL